MKPIIVKGTKETLKTGGYERLIARAEGHGIKIPRKTNADRIRAMSNEELAEWYFKVFFRNVPYCNKPECFNDSPCEQCLLDWLKQEVEDDG